MSRDEIQPSGGAAGSRLTMRELEGVVVAHVTTVHHENDTRIRAKECASLREAGAEVHLVAPDDGFTGPTDGITVHHIERRSKAARVLRSGLDAVRAVRSIRPDVIHIHDPELLVMIPLLRRDGVPVIYDVHEELPKQIRGREWIPGPLRTIAATVAQHAEPLLARLASGYVLVDEWGDRFRGRPTVVVRNLPRHSEFDSLETAPGTPSPAVDAGPPTIAYVGSITAERGALVLAEAVNLIDREIRLVLAGPIGHPDLGRRIRALDTHRRIELPGRIDRREVVDLLTRAQAAALLLKPSEAYDVARATKLYEYLLASVPIVLSDSPAHRSFHTEFGASVLVDFHDVAAVAAAIESLAFAPGPLHEQARSATVPSWNSEAAKLIELTAECATAAPLVAL